MRYVESLNQGLHRLFEADPKVLLLGEDVLDPYGGAFKVAKGLSSKYPDRVLTMPISEAGFVGLGTGLAMRGFKVVVEIMFGDFITLATDQIVNGATKFSWMYGAEKPIPLLIRAPMGGYRGYGATHSQTLECLYLNVPGLDMIAPSVLHDPGAALYDAVTRLDKPTLFIENKVSYGSQLVTDSWEKLSLHRVDDPASGLVSVKIVPGRAETCVICYGGMVPLALQALRNVYENDELVAELIVPLRIKPAGDELLAALAGKKRIVIVEEAGSQAGWGAYVAQQIHHKMFRELAAPVALVGARPTPIPCAMDQESLTLPSVADIEKALLAGQPG